MFHDIQHYDKSFEFVKVLSLTLHVSLRAKETSALTGISTAVLQTLLQPVPRQEGQRHGEADDMPQLAVAVVGPPHPQPTHLPPHRLNKGTSKAAGQHSMQGCSTSSTANRSPL